MSRSKLTFLAVLTLLSSLAVPARAQGSFYVSPSQRDLIVFINLAEGTGNLQPFYELVEFGAESLAKTVLGPRYRQVWVVKGTSATRSGLRAYLNAVAGQSSVLAVDLIFVTHGLDTGMVFRDGTYSASGVATYLVNNIAASRRAKFRMCFSTACWGSLHRQAWRNAGFKAVSGSREIYADSAASYLPFLNTWSGMSSFYTSVVAANNADPLRVNDAIASSMLWSLGSSRWDEVDSYRLRQGYTTSVSITQQLAP